MTPAPDTPPSPPIGSDVVMRGRVHAVTPGGMLCVETVTGGFVWLLPEEVDVLGLQVEETSK